MPSPISAHWPSTWFFFPSFSRHLEDLVAHYSVNEDRDNGYQIACIFCSLLSKICKKRSTCIYARSASPPLQNVFRACTSSIS